MVARLFARRKPDDLNSNPLAAAEADLARKTVARSRIVDQLADARARLEAATQGHEAALLDEDPDKVAALADERNNAQTELAGLEGLRVRIDVEVAEASAELALVRETTERATEADRIERALADLAQVAAEFEPAASRLIATLEAIAPETARVLAVLVAQARVQMASDRASVQLRADNLRRPAASAYVAEIAVPPPPHGQVAHGSRYRGHNAL
jgi:hypothetical protein